jgi:hypothetical protein
LCFGAARVLVWRYPDLPARYTRLNEAILGDRIRRIACRVVSQNTTACILGYAAAFFCGKADQPN